MEGNRIALLPCVLRQSQKLRRLCAALDVDVQRIVLSRQVHRDDVRTVTADDCGKGLWRMQDYDSADALITDVPHIPLVVFSADCNVILLHDPVRRVIGAAHAGCFSMALSMMLGEAGLTAERIETRAEVTLDKQSDGFAITAVHLVLRARVPGADAQTFEQIANKAKAGCPVSKVLNAKISLDASLDG